jgi:hypothetical protein
MALAMHHHLTAQNVLKLPAIGRRTDYFDSSQGSPPGSAFARLSGIALLDVTLAIVDERVGCPPGGLPMPPPLAVVSALPDRHWR